MNDDAAVAKRTVNERLARVVRLSERVGRGDLPNLHKGGRRVGTAAKVRSKKAKGGRLTSDNVGGGLGYGQRQQIDS